MTPQRVGESLQKAGRQQNDKRSTANQSHTASEPLNGCHHTGGSNDSQHSLASLDSPGASHPDEQRFFAPLVLSIYHRNTRFSGPLYD
jgi:hypothetical protein